jgi:C4-dicarboxylate transporter DctQ subunit
VSALTRLNVVVARLVEAATTILFLVMLVLLLQQAIGRYAFDYSPAWIGEVARYAFVWVTFLGIAAAFRHGRHVSLDFLLQRFSSTIRKVLRALVHAATLVVLLVMTWGGIQLTVVFIGQRSPAIEISMAWVYSSVTVAGAAMLLFEVEALVTEFRRRPTEWVP